MTDQSNLATSDFSADSIRAFIDMLKSPEYEAHAREKDERASSSHRLVAEAQRRGFITNDEALYYFAGIGMNGFLILSPNDRHLKEFEVLSDEMAMSQEELK